MTESESKVVPMNATTDQLCEMSHDNVQVGDFSIMTDGITVWLSERKLGAMPTQHFEISRKTFNKLITWYVSGKVPREDKRK